MAAALFRSARIPVNRAPVVTRTLTSPSRWSTRRAVARHATSAIRPDRLCFCAPTEDATAYLAASLAGYSQAGDCFLLYGDVGAGKSVFSRAFIRAATEDAGLHVPSPTYLLENVYDEYPGPAIHHYDLYRLTDLNQIARLELHKSQLQSVTLIEWAERLQGSNLCQDHIAVHIGLVDQAQLKLWQPWPGWQLPSRELATDRTLEGAYADTKWRLIHLSPHGPAAYERVQQVLDAIMPGSTEGGVNACYGFILLPRASVEAFKSTNRLRQSYMHYFISAC